MAAKRREKEGRELEMIDGSYPMNVAHNYSLGPNLDG
jgi:hypothetical protein